MFNEQVLMKDQTSEGCEKVCAYKRHLWIYQPLNSILTNSPGVLDGRNMTRIISIMEANQISKRN